MRDLRQGVTPAGHAVLDKLEKNREPWRKIGKVGRRLRDATLGVQRGELVLRAARALFEVELIDAEIALDNDATGVNLDASRRDS